MIDMANELGQRIRRARERKGWTQQQLAVAVGVGARTVGGWERGETVPLNRMARLEDVLGADVNPENDHRQVHVSEGRGVPAEIDLMFAHFGDLSQMELLRLSRLIMDVALGDPPP